jgi:hypothetical protein
MKKLELSEDEKLKDKGMGKDCVERYQVGNVASETSPGFCLN